MDVLTIFALQFLMSLVVWGSLAYWLLAPWLEKKSLNEALFFLTVPHCRHRAYVSRLAVLLSSRKNIIA